MFFTRSLAYTILSFAVGVACGLLVLFVILAIRPSSELRQQEGIPFSVQKSSDKSVGLPNSTLATYWVNISESGRCLGVQESYSNGYGENFVHYPLIRCESTGGYDLEIADQNETYALVRGVGQIREGPATGYIYHIIDLASHKLIHTGYDYAEFLGNDGFLGDDIVFLEVLKRELPATYNMEVSNPNSIQLFSVKNNRVIAEWLPNKADKLPVEVDWLNRHTFEVLHLKAKDVVPDIYGSPVVPEYEILNTEFYNIKIFGNETGTPLNVGFVKVNK